MKLLLLAAMTILPGSWFTFGIALDELDWRVRLAVGAALSPSFLGIQLYLLRIVNVDFAPAVIVILVANLPCLILIKRSLPGFNFRRPSASFWVGAAILSSLVGLMMLLWLCIPNFRIVSWHALLHTDIIYQIARNPFLPEEPDLASIALAAPWVDHAYWSITGWLTDWPPTVLYPITNIVWLIIAFVLAYELASRGLGLHRSTALLSAALTFVGTNVVGAIAYLVTGKKGFLGDIRYTPLLGKYFSFETIPFALALIVGLALVCVLILEKETRFLWSLAPILLTGLGLVYPILFPVGCILVGFTVLLLFNTSRNTSQQARRPVLLIAALIGCVVVFLFYLKGVTSARSDLGYQISAFDSFKSHTRRALVALLPAALIGLPFIIKGVLVRSRSTLLLTAAGISCIGLYLLFGIRNLEYKFILAATLFLIPLAAGGIEIRIVRSSRMRWVLSMLTPVAFSLIFAVLIFKTGAQIPDNLRNTPSIVEDSFWLQLNRNEHDSGWTRAVHHKTPDDTILVLRSSRIHIGPFANRSLFFPGLGDGDAMAGYSVQKDYYLLEQRGYSKVSFEHRSSIIQTLYTEADVKKLAEAVNALLAFQRPIAIHFVPRDTPSLLWMKKNNIGSELYSDAENVVWFLKQEQLNFQLRQESIFRDAVSRSL